jgi:hypothetical protein
MALAVQGFAFLGKLVGAFTIAVGIGPQARGDCDAWSAGMRSPLEKTN